MEQHKITRMLVEDIIKTYWDGYYPIIENEPLTCREDGYQAFSISGVSIHMKKIHQVYTARGDRKRQLYHTKDLLPGQHLRKFETNRFLIQK